MTLAGFPHSGTPGSTPTCGSPRLFAACRALLRLSVPRHPPCALSSLDRFFSHATSLRRGSNRSTDSQSLFTHAVLSRLLSTLRVTTHTQSHDPCFQANQKLRSAI